MSTRFRLDPELDPWERQPGEPADEYDLWLQYRNDGHGRSHTKVAERFEIKPQVVHRVAKQNAWTRRLAALRAHEKQQIAERVDAILDQALPAYTQAVARMAVHSATAPLDKVPADRALAQVTNAFRTLIPEEHLAELHLTVDQVQEQGLSQFDLGDVLLSALAPFPEARQAAIEALRKLEQELDGAGGGR